MNNITITIQAPELIEAMQALTVALQTGAVKPADVEATIEKLEVEAEKPPKAKKETKAEPVKLDKPSTTLEEVRAKLAQLSQSGKQAEVKNLIAAMGATKLTEVSADKYAELLAQAEAL
jgi:hypothetical protein